MAWGQIGISVSNESHVTCQISSVWTRAIPDQCPSSSPRPHIGILQRVPPSDLYSTVLVCIKKTICVVRPSIQDG